MGVVETKSVRGGTIALPVPDGWDAFMKKAGSGQVFVFALSLALPLHTRHLGFMKEISFTEKTDCTWSKILCWEKKNNHWKYTSGIVILNDCFCISVSQVRLARGHSSSALCGAGICPGLTRHASNQCVQLRGTELRASQLYLYLSLKGQSKQKYDPHYSASSKLFSSLWRKRNIFSPTFYPTDADKTHSKQSVGESGSI